MANTKEINADWSVGACVRECGGDVQAFYHAFAGQEIYIPLTMKPDHALAEMLGMDVATKLSKAAGGCNFHVPTSQAKQTDLTVLLLSHTELKVAKIANIAKISQRHVFEIRRQWREAGFLPHTKQTLNSPKGAI